MENIKIAIITEDKEYGRALGLALVDVYRYFTVTLYKSVPLHNELDSMDLVLSDVQEDFEIGGKNILLTEKISQINKNYDDNIFSLYKYSNARNMTGELLFIYSSLTGRRSVPIRNVNSKVLVFCSAAGGSGCTSAAFAFARELKRAGDKKVIYVSMEELESTAGYVDFTSNGRTISDYLYYLLNKDGTDKYPFLESYIEEDPYGVDAFVPSPGRNVLKSLSTGEIQYFVNAVLDTGGYDYILIDTGNSLAQNALTCFEMANVIYDVSRGEEDNRNSRFMEYLMFTKGEVVCDKIEPLVLPDDPDSFSLQNGIRMISPTGRYCEVVMEYLTKLT